MLEKSQILKELESEVMPILSDYNKVAHLFSKDEGVQALAKLNKAINRIKFLLKSDQVKDIVFGDKPYFTKPLFGGKPGALVSVRPCGKEYGDKTYIGFLIGDAATSLGLSIEGITMKVEFGGGNPAIFIPETGTVVMGYESWWAEITSEDDFRQITDKDIENTWYVKLLKQMKGDEQK